MKVVAVALVFGLAGCHALDDRVTQWKLTPEEWRHTVVPMFAPFYDDYSRAFDAVAPALATQITQVSLGAPLFVRPHFAGDPMNTVGQQRTRWAMPTLAPARVITVGGKAVDAVFVHTEHGWGAIVGVDEMIVTRARAMNADCTSVLTAIGTKRCEEVAFLVAEAALMGDRGRLTHACSLAATACVVNRSP
ncbi:MAG TPA: hypothetical protein VGM90_13085 [Kofleriaceae bacterium]|jgi:hypothetical protein